MANADRVRWDKVFREHRKAYPAPDPLLLEIVPPVDDETPPRALDLAGGVGQNGIWLATQGYTVDILDISRVGLERARREMIMQNLRNVNLLQVDLDHWEVDTNLYDLVCVFRYLKRRLFPLIKMAVKPGGRVIYETFNQAYLQRVPAFNPEFLLEPGELAGFFSDWMIERQEESGYVSRIIASKPY